MVIVDDVCTTLGSTVKAIERVRQAGMKVLGPICLVDRKTGARQAIEEQLCPSTGFSVLPGLFRNLFDLNIADAYA